MKHTIILLLLWTGISSLWAQAPTIIPAPKVEVRDAQLVDNFFIGTNGEHYYTAEVQYTDKFSVPRVVRSFVIQEQSVDMQSPITKSGKLDFNKKDGHIENIILGKKEIFIFLSVYKKRECILSVKTISLSSLEEIGEIREVMRVPQQDKNVKRYDDFRFQMQPNKSNLLIWYQYEAEAEENESISLALFDAEMQQVWSMIKTLKTPEQHFLQNQIRLDRQGNTLLAAGMYQTKAEGFRPFPDDMSELQVWVWDQKGQKERYQKITLAEPIISAIHLQLSPDGDLVCGGFYQEEESAEIQGTFYVRYKQNGDLAVENYAPLEEDFIQNPESHEQIDPDSCQQQILIRRMPLMADGGAILIAESRLTLHSTYGASDFSYYVQALGPLSLIRFGKDGKVIWQRKIEKEQLTMTFKPVFSKTAMNSYQMILTKDKIGLIYNTFPPKVDEDEMEEDPSKERDPLKIKLSTLSSQGIIEHYDISASKKDPRYFQIENLVQYSANSLIMRIDEDGSYRYAKVRLE